jgi:hypothetical protein
VNPARLTEAADNGKAEAQTRQREPLVRADDRRGGADGSVWPLILFLDLGLSLRNRFRMK